MSEICVGFLLDSFARQHLWQIGLDYRHGTGHGVGSFLNVHEGLCRHVPLPTHLDLLQSQKRIEISCFSLCSYDFILY